MELAEINIEIHLKRGRAWICKQQQQQQQQQKKTQQCDPNNCENECSLTDVFCLSANVSFDSCIILVLDAVLFPKPLLLLTVVLVNGLTGPSVLLVAMVVNNKDIDSVITLTQSMVGRTVMVTCRKSKTVTL